MKRVRVALLVAVCLASFAPLHRAHAAQCVTVKFVDKAGVVIPTEKPLVGLMLGGSPAVEAQMPAGARALPGPPAPCPESLVASTRELFEGSCVSEEKRNKAARANNVGRAKIDKGCRDMAEALK